jgi:hypothetical protein
MRGFAVDPSIPSFTCQKSKELHADSASRVSVKREFTPSASGKDLRKWARRGLARRRLRGAFDREDTELQNHHACAQVCDYAALKPDGIEEFVGFKFVELRF